jgi:lysozyme family protein
MRESEDMPMRENIDELIDGLIAREGGFVDHPADKGGPTRWGITQSVARRHGYMGQMENLPRNVAALIYTKQYWRTPAFDKVAQIAPILAEELFHTGVNMGTSTAIGFLQRALNALNRNGADYPDIAVDRTIGTDTLRALEAFLTKRGPSAEGVLTKAIDALQGAHGPVFYMSYMLCCCGRSRWGLLPPCSQRPRPILRLA